MTRLALAVGLLACGTSVSCGDIPPAGSAMSDSATAKAAIRERALADSSIRFDRVRTGAHVTDVASSPSASWADFDGDGDDDLYVLNGYASLQETPEPQRDALYRNDGDGGFVAVEEHALVAEPAFSGSSTWGDYDNDGDLDVFVANQRGDDNFLYRNDGDGSFVRITEGAVVGDGGRSFSAVWVDIDGDGRLDLHVLNGRDGRDGQLDFVYRNLGAGGFERVEGLPFADEPQRSGGAAWADYDDDGDVDLYLPVYSTQPVHRLYRNDGDWTFTEVGEGIGLTIDPLPFAPPTSVAHWVDADGDMDLDLFVGNTRGTIDYLFENDGRGAFERAAAGRIGLDTTYVSDAAWGDFDNDADLDLVVAAWGGAPALWVNDGHGRLRPRVPAGDLGTEVVFASSVSAGDADGDGDLDLYVTQWPIDEVGGAPNLFYENEGAAGGWLEIDLEGTASNGSTVGAEVVVAATIDGREQRQLRHVSARTSWRSAGSRTQHFGLGDATEVDWIEVRWPSGAVERVVGPVEIDRRVRIVEGSGEVRPAQGSS